MDATVAFRRAVRRLPKPVRALFARNVGEFGRGASTLEQLGRVAFDSLSTPEDAFIRRVTCWTEQAKRAAYADGMPRGTAPQSALHELLSDSRLPDFGSAMLRADTERYLPDDCLFRSIV